MQNEMDATQAAQAAQETPSSEKNTNPNTSTAMTLDEEVEQATSNSVFTTNTQSHSPPSSSSTSPASSPSPTPTSIHTSTSSMPMTIAPLQEKPLTPDCSSTSSESTESADANVEQVLAKSKKAASFLWLLLHAQHCPIPHDTLGEPCPVKGCRQVKRLLLHTKSCPARNSPTAPCPCNYQGCQDARKLLAHYKNARLQRKQSRVMMSNKAKGLNKQQQQQQPTSLILTLLARHDKEMTEKLNRKNVEHEQQRQRRQRLQRLQSLTTETDSSTEAAAIALTMFTSSFPKSTSNSPSPSFNSHTKTVQFNLNSTRSNENEIYDRRMPPPAPRTRSRTSSVGSIPSLLRAAKVKSKRSINSRPRAGSLDERRSLSRLSSSNTYVPNDPTVELELLKPTTNFDIPNHYENNIEQVHHDDCSEDVLPFRKRSVSCSGVINNPARGRFCDTIMEE